MKKVVKNTYKNLDKIITITGIIALTITSYYYFETKNNLKEIEQEIDRKSNQLQDTINQKNNFLSWKYKDFRVLEIQCSHLPKEIENDEFLLRQEEGWRSNELFKLNLKENKEKLKECEKRQISLNNKYNQSDENKYQERIDKKQLELQSIQPKYKEHENKIERFSYGILFSTSLTAIGLILIFGKSLIMSINQKINQEGNFGVGVNSGEVKADKLAGTINEAEQQNLAQAAAEIEQLLQQITETYPTTTTKEKMVVATEAIERIETNPDWKKRIVNAAKKGGLAAMEKGIEKATDSVIASTIAGAIKGWLGETE